MARGIERYLYQLANALAACNVQVEILTWRWENPIQMDVLDPRVRVRILPTSRYFAAQAIVPFYVWHFTKEKYDYVWIFFAGYGEAEALALVPGQRFGIVLHYPYEQVPHRYREFKRYGLASRAADIVSVSQAVANGAREAFGRTSQVIPHGIDTAQFQPASESRERLRRQLGLPEHFTILLTVAALEERKGIQYVIQALPIVRKQFPDLVYIVLGEGAWRDSLNTQIKGLNLEASVQLPGVREDVVAYYQAADVFILLSRGEALPFAPLEAMACELPVLCSAHAPFDQLIEPAFGIMVDEQDSERVAETILALLKQPEQRRKMGKAGRAKICAEFVWHQVAAHYLNLMKAHFPHDSMRTDHS